MTSRTVSWLKLTLLGLAFVLIGTGGYLLVRNDDSPALADSPPLEPESTTDDCEIDEFLLEHANTAMCVSDLNAPIELTNSTRALLLAGRAAVEVEADPWSRTRDNFVNWENPHVHPIDITPNGDRLLAVNTPDHSLMVFDISDGSAVQIATIPVGLEPVSVRARSNSEVWVVNHASDSVSIVDLELEQVVASIDTDDEPADVVFAGSPQRAFVSASQANQLNVFNPDALSDAPVQVFINGEDPRALAVSNDGSEVYLAIFESGNGTTALTGGKSNNWEEDLVRRPEGPYGGIDVPPNDGVNYNPPLNPDNAAPPPVSMIVRKDDQGRWMDDNNGDWSRFVTGDLADLGGVRGGRVDGWDLPDRDVAIIDANALDVTYQTRLMNANMALAVHPTTGDVTVVGTDATNEIRWEPNLNGTFLRVNMARFTPGGADTILDLNPHLDYSVPTLPQSVRDQSIGDPRGIVWNAAGTNAYITGMGSNNVVVVDANGNRLDRIEVGEGPTGIVIRPNTNQAYVMNKFDGSISVINLDDHSETERVTFFDPTPQAIKDGRPHLYDTHATSGLGHLSCASCHIDGRTDRLAWDLGDPSGEGTVIRDLNANGVELTVTHPAMKGPLLTMSLQDIVGHPNMHWSGDKANLGHFDAAFVSLQGDDAPPSAEEINEFETFLDSIHIPSNPYRELDNSYPTDVEIPGPNGTIERVGDANLGAVQFENGCRRCHPGNSARGDAMAFSGGFGIGVLKRPPTWRNFGERFGFWLNDATGSNSGFGFQQDGTFDSRHNGSRSNNLMAFMLSFNGRFPYEADGLNAGNESKDTHAAVGKQVLLSSSTSVADSDLLDQLVAIADTGAIGLVAKTTVGGEQRGYAYTGESEFQSDRANETVTLAALEALATGDNTLLFTAVTAGSETRIGIDRDMDGVFNQDSSILNQCASSANVAQLGSATQSSLFQGTRFPASNAIDGNYTNFTHTASDDALSTWELTLDQDHLIDEIVLHNRTSAQSRLRDITVYVLDETGQHVLFKSHYLNRHNRNNGPDSITLDLPAIIGAPVEGRIVRVVREPDPLLLATDGAGNVDEAGVLSLAEVEVFACVEGEDSAEIIYGDAGNHNHQWKTVSFAQTADVAPVVLSAMQTFNGPDTAKTAVQDVTNGGFDVRVEEEQSRESETSHTNERVHYVAMLEGGLRSAENERIGQAGSVTHSQADAATWTRITFDHAINNPVVFMDKLSSVNSDPFAVHIRNVTTTSFEFQIDEWNYLDGASSDAELLGWLVVESGEHMLADGSRLQVSTGEASADWVTVGMNGAFEAAPTVIAMVQTRNESDPVVVRLDDVVADSFAIRLQAEEANSATISAETVGFLVIGTPAVAEVGCNTSGLNRHVWQAVFSGEVSGLLSDSRFPNNPNSIETIGDFVLPTNAGDTYGSRMFGYLTPPVSGSYTFFVASDNEGQLWLSSDADAANLQQIAQTFWSPEQVFTWSGGQQSATFQLEAGQQYAIEGLHQTSWGSDYYAVAWQIDGGAIEIIPESALCHEGNAARSRSTVDENPPLLNEAAIVVDFSQSVYLRTMDAIEADAQLHSDVTNLVNTFALKVLRNEPLDDLFIATVDDLYQRTYAAADADLQVILSQLWTEYDIAQYADDSAQVAWRAVNERPSVPTAVGFSSVQAMTAGVWPMLLVMGMLAVSGWVVFGRKQPKAIKSTE